jgi:outer membrane murein-binding lipoprotein Lpp
MPTSHSSLRSPEYYERDVVTERPRGPRPSAVNNNDYSTVKRRPTGKRIVRAVARFFIAVLIGAGATLAWQSYGDAAMKMVRTEAPSLAWLLPVSAAKPSLDDQGSTAAAASSPQLERLELSLLMVRRGVDQLAAMVEQLSAKQDQLAVKQDQMSHIAVLKSLEPRPQSRAVPPRKPPQPTAQSSATQSSSVPAPPPPTEQPLR